MTDTMRKIAAASFLLASVSTLHSQTSAVADLHRTVLDVLRTDSYEIDVNAAARLGLFYLEGQDRERGCGLLYLAAQADVYRNPVPPSSLEQLLDMRCTNAEREAAPAWQECWQFGQSYPQIFELDAGYWIELGPKTVRIQTPSGTFDRERGGGPCFHHVVLIRHARVDPPDGVRRPSRHLIESFAWQSHLQDGAPVRELRWFVEEALGNTWDVRIVEALVKGPGSAWPAPALPQELLDAVRFRMNRAGKVVYFIGGRFQRRGTID